jgi:L-amino acid N-acyltransferase YncA
MDYSIRDAKSSDRDQVVAIFNHFVRTSYAAYPDEEADPEFFDSLQNRSEGLSFLVVEIDDQVIGFGLVGRYHQSAAFVHTGVLTYFILPQYTRSGIGTALLHRLVAKARERGISHLLAHISSRNEQSLEFHHKHGFTECGRFTGIGNKFSRTFDVVWVQKEI